jgi:hypothetical protein
VNLREIWRSFVLYGLRRLARVAGRRVDSSVVRRRCFCSGAGGHRSILEIAASNRFAHHGSRLRTRIASNTLRITKLRAMDTTDPAYGEIGARSTWPPHRFYAAGRLAGMTAAGWCGCRCDPIPLSIKPLGRRSRLSRPLPCAGFCDVSTAQRSLLCIHAERTAPCGVSAWNF